MHRTALLAVLALVVASAATLVAAPPAAAAGPVTYQPPVAGDLVDGFRAPATRWGPGNRGVDYATTPGAPVVAAGPGEVVFAGVVAGANHVVVLHPDGLRTSYSFLGSVTVRRGARVAAGDTVGTAGPSLHFGARAGNVYLDPLALLGGPPEVHLVPDDARHAGSAAAERTGLARFLQATGAVLARAAGAAASAARDAAVAEVRRRAAAVQARLDAARGWAHYARSLLVDRNPWNAPALVATTFARWRAQQANCTPPDRPPPPRAGRHLLVTVAGLGSHTGQGLDRADAGGVADLDERALGYAPEDTVQFSYAGGTTIDHPYDAADTQAGLRDAALQLRRLLVALAADHPGVPIDIVAHSQGGLVARAALVFEFAGVADPVPAVANVVTLATPHHGADLATGVAMVQTTAAGAALGGLGHLLTPGGYDPRSPGIADLAEHSRFIRDLNAAPLPASVAFTSVAARGDLLVTVRSAHLDGATNVVVDPGGVLDRHGQLPGSSAAQREVALALAGAPPTCESLTDALVDTALSEAIGAAEDLGGAAATAALASLTRTKGP